MLQRRRSANLLDAITHITLWRGAAHDSARDAAWMHDCFTPSPRRHH